jgi:hypothetical protein
MFLLAQIGLRNILAIVGVTGCTDWQVESQQCQHWTAVSVEEFAVFKSKKSVNKQGNSEGICFVETFLCAKKLALQLEKGLIYSGRKKYGASASKLSTFAEF